MKKAVAVAEIILSKVGIKKIADKLINLPGSTLYSMLLAVCKRRAQKVTPRQLMNPDEILSAACKVEQRRLLAIDQIAYAILDPRFRDIELSPVEPFGLASTLGGVNQQNILATIRGVEVLSDPTTALSVECARERKALLTGDPKSETQVHMATSSRNLRLQDFSKIPGFVPHFRTIALASAGRDIGHESFKINALSLHIDFYLRLIEELSRQHAYEVHCVTVKVSHMSLMEAVIAAHKLDRIEIGRQVQLPGFSVFAQHNIDTQTTLGDPKELTHQFIAKYSLERAWESLSIIWENAIVPLKNRFPSFAFEIDLDRAAGIGYYPGICFKIFAINRAGHRYPLVDGGCTDWTKILLSSKKERVLVSGFGTELFETQFRTS